MSSEHIVLADCRDGNGAFLSQMAYFGATDPLDKPNDIVVVGTPAGQTAVWPCANWSETWTTSGVTFTADLGPKGANGTFAGYGSNGYDYNNGGFRCWQEFIQNRYDYGNGSCSQVYNCDHRNAPANNTAQPTCDPTSSASTSGSNNKLSTGAIVGIAMGSTTMVLLFIVVGYLFQQRRRRQKTQKRSPGLAEMHATQGSEPLASTKPPSGPPGYLSTGVSPQEPTHELADTAGPVEAEAGAPPAELAGHHAGAELAATDSAYFNLSTQQESSKRMKK